MIDNHLRYFIVAARLEHLGRAAEQLGLSQPTLSRSISRLEEQYGAKLFDRTGRRMRLSAIGRILLIRAQAIIAALDDTEREMRAARANARQLIAIGFLATFGIRVIPDLIRSSTATLRDAQFRLLQGSYPQLRDCLLGGEIDLCLVSPRLAEANLAWHALYDEDIILIVPRGHRLEGRLHVDLTDIAREPIVALKKGYGLRQILDDAARHAGFTPEINFEGEEVATLHGLVGAGFGVALVPKGEFKNTDLIKGIALRNPDCKRTVGLAWRLGRYLPASTERFRDHIIRLYKKGRPI